jgi:hypothetical protein
MKTLHGLIRKVAKESAAAGGPLRVNIFQVILHPTSFSQTVENFFDLSFLVKDGSVALSKEGDAMYVAPSKPPKTDDFMSGLFKTQNILQIDYPTYRRLVARWCTPQYPTLLPCRGAAGGASNGDRSSASPRKQQRTG